MQVGGVLELNGLFDIAFQCVCVSCAVELPLNHILLWSYFTVTGS